MDRPWSGGWGVPHRFAVNRRAWSPSFGAGSPLHVLHGPAGGGVASEDAGCEWAGGVAWSDVFG